MFVWTPLRRKESGHPIIRKFKSHNGTSSLQGGFPSALQFHHPNNFPGLQSPLRASGLIFFLKKRFLTLSFCSKWYLDEILGETLTFPASHIVVPQIIIYFVLVYALHNIVNGTENFKRGEILLALVQITLFHFIKILLGQNTIQVTSKYSGLGRNLN